MCEECTPPTPVTRMLDRSGFGYAVGCVKSDASSDIQEIASLGGCLMWKNAVLCGGRVRLKYFLRVWSDMWKYFERESAMMFSVPLLCCDYRDVLLLTRVHPRQQDTASCDYSFDGSKYALCIQPRTLELSVNANMCEPCTSCRMVM